MYFYVHGRELVHYRVDILWWNIGHMVIPESSAKRFCHLLKVTELVLALPHSSTVDERLSAWSVRIRPDSRSSLRLDGTLSNLLAMKLH